METILGAMAVVALVCVAYEQGRIDGAELERELFDAALQRAIERAEEEGE